MKRLLYIFLLISLTVQSQGFDWFLNASRQQYLNETPPTPFEDYYNLVANFGTNNHVTFDQQPVWNGNPTDDFVHPSVLHFDTAWNGHNYWMYITAYADTQGSTENPYLFYSDDGQTWLTPSGIPAPLHTYNSDGITDTAHLSDTWIMMVGNTMYLFNRGNLNAGGSYWEYRTTTDASTFSTRTRIISSADGFADYVSASFIVIDGTWYMFGTDATEQTQLSVLTSTSINGTWTEINRITSDSGSLWHTEVHYNPDDTYFYVLGSTNYIDGGNLMFGKFSDVMANTMETRNTFLLPLQNQTWNNAYYKSSFIIKDNAMELYLGTKGAGLDSNTDWRVQKVTTSRLTPTLDLSGYTLTATYPFADVSNGFTNGMLDSNYNRIALQYTVVDPTDFDVQVARFGTGSFYRFHNSGRTLYGADWTSGIDTPVLSGSILYGLKVDDVVTIIKDDTNYTIYVNGNNVYQKAFDANVQLGTLFGDFANNGSIKDLKVYKKPEWIFSPSAFDAKLTQLYADSAITPSNYLIADNFNRATLGTTDVNGTSFDLIGTPIINSSTRIQLGGNIYGKYHNETNYVVYVKPDPTPFTSGRVYFEYTDANNYRYLEFKDLGTALTMVTTTAGSVSEVTIPIVKNYASYSTFAFKIEGDLLTIYGDNVKLKQYTMPSVGFNKFVGISSGYSDRYVTDFIAKIGSELPADITPPTVPTGLIASNITDVSATVSWSASTDTYGVAGYKIYSNGNLIANVGNVLTYNLSGLTPSTLYNITVSALDLFNNESAQSTELAVTTDAPDTQAPTAPTNLVTSNITYTTIDLNWTASTDNYAVVNYRVYDNDVLLATVGSNATSYQLTGLSQNTNYLLTVRALDFAGNESTNSNLQDVTTVGEPTTADQVTAFMTVAAIPNDGTVYFSGTAQEITGAGYHTALTNLIDGFKTNGTWTKRKAIWVMIGGTKNSCKYNVKNPQDTDAAHRLTFFGDAWKTEAGALGIRNASYSIYPDVYANSHFNPFTNLTLNSASLEVYVQSVVESDRFIGCFNDPNYFIIEKGSGNIKSSLYHWSGEVVYAQDNTFKGLISVSRTSSTDLRLYTNGVQRNINTTTNTYQAPNFNVFLLGVSNGATISNTASGWQSFVSINEGLTPSEVAADAVVIEAFQTALGRGI